MLKPDRTTPSVAVVVPIRSFTGAKQRLVDVTTPTERAELVQDWAARTIAAASGHPTAIVTNDLDVHEFAAKAGLEVLEDPGNLDGAAEAGRRWAREIDATRLVVLHADLPFVRSIDPLTALGASLIAVIVPDQRRDGTPALSIPVDAPFRFAYGPGSFARHCIHAEAAGLAVEILVDPDLGFDVDLPEDLAALRARIPTR